MVNRCGGCLWSAEGSNKIGIFVLSSRGIDLVVKVRIFDVQFAGIDSYDGALLFGLGKVDVMCHTGLTVLFMHPLDFEQKLPVPDHIVIELIETRDGRESRPWELAKGMEVETVDALNQVVTNGDSTPEPQ